jgi:hypothetical protein
VYSIAVAVGFFVVRLGFRGHPRLRLRGAGVGPYSLCLSATLFLRFGLPFRPRREALSRMPAKERKKPTASQTKTKWLTR